MILTGIYFLNSLDFGNYLRISYTQKKRKISEDGWKIQDLDALRIDKSCINNTC